MAYELRVNVTDARIKKSQLNSFCGLYGFYE